MSVPTAQSTVAESSEQEILDWLTARVAAPRPGSGVVLGIGDDAAVLHFTGDVVATTDTLVHGPDFRLAWSSGYDVGWKAVAVNVADVAAMGAEPTGLLLALTLPAETTLGWLAELYRGVGEACAALAPNASVAGGDLTVSPTLTIAVTAFGDLHRRAPVTRAGARPGDVVMIAGEQGHAIRGLDLLFRRFRDAQSHPVPVDRSTLNAQELHDLDRQLRPQPPIAAGLAAARSGATAMMDVSDGLVLDARRLARASGVDIDLQASFLGDDPRAALAGGEDHALLATFSTPASAPEEFRVIGRVLAQRVPGTCAVSVDGAPYDDRGGWDPYQDWDAALG